MPIWPVLLCLLAVAPASALTPPTILGKSAVLMDSVTGKVLYEKHCHEKRPPASLTKVMTAILAMENASLNKTVCASPHASETEYGSLHLKPGEKLSLEDLLYGLLLRSANDAAVCVAENIAGSEQKFALLMNKKAKEIGANDTHFVNPHGLYDPQHYSTAYDLALISRYAIRYPEFNSIVSTKRTRIDRTIDSLDVSLKNTAGFLWHYEGADGIKTGYIKQSGHCFIGSATRGKWRLIAVVMNSRNPGHDVADLMDYGFKYFKPVVLAKANQVMGTAQVEGGKSKTVRIVTSDALGQVRRKELPAATKTNMQVNKIFAPINRGEKVGTLTGYVNGKSIGSVNLLADESVGRTFSAAFWHYARPPLLVLSLGILGYFSYGRAVAKITRRRRRGVSARG